MYVCKFIYTHMYAYTHIRSQYDVANSEIIYYTLLQNIYYI